MRPNALRPRAATGSFPHPHRTVAEIISAGEWPTYRTRYQRWMDGDDPDERAVAVAHMVAAQ